MTLINSSRLWVLVRGYLHRERCSTRTVTINITTTIKQCDPTQKARKVTAGQGHKSFPGEPQLQLKPLIKQPLLQGVSKTYLFRDSISSIFNFVIPVKSSISSSTSTVYLHGCVIVSRKFSPNFAHSVRKKITDS